MRDVKQAQKIVTVRRSFLKASGLGALFLGAPAIAKVTSPVRPSGRQIRMDHLHTSERIGLVYAEGSTYLDPALAKLNHFLRDHYTNEIGFMDPTLYDLLHDVHVALGARSNFHIISGYRSPKTNEHLRTTRGGGVAKRSLHMDGKAIDVRLPGIPLNELRDAAISLGRGGVGYYPKDQFVHVDTGRVRTW